MATKDEKNNNDDKNKQESTWNKFERIKAEERGALKAEDVERIKAEERMKQKSKDGETIKDEIDISTAWFLANHSTTDEEKKVIAAGVKALKEEIHDAYAPRTCAGDEDELHEGASSSAALS